MEEKDSKTMISVKHLSKKFGDVTVLKDISLDIKEKEVVVIIGPSGSGKTTLLNLLAALDKPTGGQIRLKYDSSLLESLGNSERRRNRHRRYQTRRRCQLECHPS